MKKQNKKAFQTVKSGYDKIGNRYNDERNKFDNWREIDRFISLLPSRGKILDAGSGTGIPVARYLTQNKFEVTGVDISTTMVSVTGENVPEARFYEMNLTEIDFPKESFDGVISTYTIIHIPREEHEGVFKSFHDILKPKGIMLVSVASWAWEEYAEYIGSEMFWSHYDPDKSQKLIAKAGFELIFFVM